MKTKYFLIIFYSSLAFVNFSQTRLHLWYNTINFFAGGLAQPDGVDINNIDSITFSSFTFGSGSGVTFDGYNYQTIVMGNGQEWMAENLRTSIYANGDPIINASNPTEWDALSTMTNPNGVCADYPYNLLTQNPYGKLYNWYAVADTRNVCPSGWHVPSQSEWYTLVKYIDPSSFLDINGVSSAWAGGMMKITGTQYWLILNWMATNSSGFSAYPGGYIDVYGGQLALNQQGYWWSTTSIGANSSWCIELLDQSPLFDSNPENQENGLSIRCLKD